MVVIALFAVIAASLGVWVASGLMILATLFAIPIVLTAPGRRLEAAAWFLCACPVLYLCSLYATWLSAWVVLRHRPSWVVDDPDVIFSAVPVQFIVTVILMLICPIALVFCGPLMFAAVRERMRRKDIGAFGAAARLSVPLGLWLCVYAIARWESLSIRNILGWFLD
jgi:hypothetical protein